MSLIIDVTKLAGLLPEGVNWGDELTPQILAAALAADRAHGAEPVGNESYVQQVPDHCDRIVWRKMYYHLPISARPQPVTVS